MPRHTGIENSNQGDGIGSLLIVIAALVAFTIAALNPEWRDQLALALAGIIN